jgi:hypothetical protein
VQLLLPVLGWRGLFWAVALLLALAAAMVFMRVPADTPVARPADGLDVGYLHIARHPMFMRTAPLAFFVYGGMIAVQALWAGPWLVRVAGLSPLEAARGLFVLNLAMLAAFFAWGWVSPRLHARGWGATRLIRAGLPVSLAIGALAVWRGPEAGAWTWTAYCAASTGVALSLQQVGQAYPPALAGRALSAYNLVVFAGVFAAQWGIGLAVDVLRALGLGEVSAFRGAFALWGCCGVASAWWFAVRRPHADATTHP